MLSVAEAAEEVVAGRKPSPNGGASCDGSGTGETIENAHGSPDASAAAAAPQAPSSTNKTSGCSFSIACSRSRSWKGARAPNWPRPELRAPKRVRAFQSSGSKRSISRVKEWASRPSARSRSTSSIPQRTATRCPRCASSSSVATSGYSRPGTASTYARTTAIAGSLRRRYAAVRTS